MNEYERREQEFNEPDFDRLGEIEKDYKNIRYDKTHDEKLYETALEKYFDSEKFQNFTEEQKSQTKDFFDQIKSSMDKPEKPGKFKLPKQFYLDVVRESIGTLGEYDPDKNFDDMMKYQFKKLDYVRDSDNRFDKEAASLIWDLYQREDIAVGIHGTYLKDDFDISPENCSFLKRGIDLNYKSGDARRTINFQDLPGHQNQFGKASFLKIMNYQYRDIHDNKENGAYYNCIVARPKEMSTTYDENCPDELSMVKPVESTRIVGATNWKYQHYRIKPEYILFMVKNNETFVRNPNCDLEKIAALNEPLKERNNELREQEEMTEKLRRETENVKTKGVFAKLKEIFSKDRNKGSNQKDTQEGR